MILRAGNNQHLADELRDNIGASTEYAAFFILANGILENLSHSVILAAPGYIATGAYDNIYRALRTQNAPENPLNSSHQEKPRLNRAIKFYDTETALYDTEITALAKVQQYLEQDDLWKGLRKRQTAYQDNKIETQIKEDFADLIDKLRTQKSFGDYFIESKSQSLADSLLLLKSYQEVYAKNGTNFQIKDDIDNFIEAFSLQGVFLKEPSESAVGAAFCLKAHHQMVNFDERISTALPHMPSGRQVLLASALIATIYSAKEIYQAVTGQEETATDYVTNFPDHLFSWLQLGQMYENLGGDATISDSFRDFFAKFNFVENSTHLGIVLAPVFAYQQIGSKMFEDHWHQFQNLKSYLGNSADHYYQKLVSVFDKSRSQSETLVDVDLEAGSSNGYVTNPQRVGPKSTRSTSPTSQTSPRQSSKPTDFSSLGSNVFDKSRSESETFIDLRSQPETSETFVGLEAGSSNAYVANPQRVGLKLTTSTSPTSQTSPRQPSKPTDVSSLVSNFYSKLTK